MNIIINPYYRSVKIDDVEVIQKIIPFPDYYNHLASITCLYDESKKEIKEIHSMHRYVSHYIEKEYYYNNLQKFVEWFNSEKKAQKDNGKKAKKDLEDLIESKIKEILDLEGIKDFTYNKEVHQLILSKKEKALVAILPTATEEVDGLMSFSDKTILNNLSIQTKSNSSNIDTNIEDRIEALSNYVATLSGEDLTYGINKIEEIEEKLENLEGKILNI